MTLLSDTFGSNYVVSTFLSLLVTICSPSVYSEPPPAMGDQKGLLASADKSFSNESGSTKSDKGNKHKSSPILPGILCSDINDEPTRKICWGAYQAGLNYFHGGLEHRQKVFKWQYLSSLIIFFVVLTLVGIGVYFAWIQFRIDINTGNTDSNKNHSVEVSTSGIKVSSPVLGVIILTLSLAFFYLYLAFVYPITEIF